MQRKFLLNLILIIVVNLLIKPFYLFGVDRSVQNLVGSESYGLFYSLFNLSFILSVILDPGITNYNNRHIAQYSEKLTRYFSTITSIKVLLSALYCVVLFIYAIASGFNPAERVVLFALVLGQIFNSFILYNRSNLAGLHLFKSDTLVSILDKLIMIVICAPFLYISSLRQHFSITEFIYLQTFSFFITALISFFMVKSYTRKFKPGINIQLFTIILKESYPYALLALLMVIYTKADTVILRELHPNGNKEVGIYAAAYRILDALNMIAVLFSGLLYPLFSRMIKDRSNLNPLTRLSFSLLVIPATVLSISTFFYSTEIIGLLYHHEIERSSLAFSILILSFIAISNSYIFGTLLTANGSIKLLNTIALGGVIVNLSLNFILIQKYGAIGSAYAALITTTLVTLTQTKYAYQNLNLSIKKAGIIKFILLILFLVLLLGGTKGLLIHWVIKLSFCVGLSIITAIIIKLIPIKEIFILIRDEKN